MRTEMRTVILSLALSCVLAACSSEGVSEPVKPVAAVTGDAGIQASRTPDADRPHRTTALELLKAEGTAIVTASGRPFQLKGLALGGWLFNETWITALDHNLHSRLALEGDKRGLSEEVRDALLVVGPFSGSPDDTAGIASYLDTMEVELARQMPAQAAADLVDAANLPLLYDDSDRYLLTVLEQRFGTSGRDALMGIFQDAWIQESDIRWMAEQGFNMVRVPMGYRTLMNVSEFKPLAGPASFKEASFQRIDRLLDWCDTYGVYAVLDIQEAPGGQNNYSGSSTLYTDPAMQQLTLELWQYISSRYKNRSTVAAYSLLAEPMSAPSVEEMMKLYDRIYDAIRAQNDPHLMVIHDGFKGLGKMKSPKAMGWNNVVYSTHLFEWGISSYEAYKAYIKGMELTFSNVQRRLQVPIYIGSFSTFIDEAWAYQSMKEYLLAFDRQGWAWTMWTYKRIDDPVEYDVWGTTTAWGVWQAMQSPSDWRRVDIHKDSYEVLAADLARYTTDRMTLNTTMYNLYDGYLGQ